MAGLWLLGFRRHVDSRCGHFWTVRLFTSCGFSAADHRYAADDGLISDLGFEHAINGSAKQGARSFGPQTYGGDCEEAQYI